MKKKEIFLMCILLFLDQISKWGMDKYLNGNVVELIPNFFKLEMAYNQGGAFSIMNGKMFLLIFASIVALVFLFFFQKSVKDTVLKWISFAFLNAGIIGNLVDRIFFGYVRDFLSFKIFSYDFPIFNLADVFIIIGVGFLFIIFGRGEVIEND